MTAPRPEADLAAGPRLRPPRHGVERRTVWWWTAQGAACTLPVVLLALGVTLLWPAARPWSTGALLVAVVLSLVLAGVEPWWRLRVHRWEVTAEAVYGQSGWWVRERRVTPISRIQTVDTVRGPLEQLLGLATLRVTTASSAGAVDLVGLDPAVAESLAEQLSEITAQTPGDAT